MSTKASGVLASATAVLTRAVELDKNKRFTESLVCYQEGIHLLMDAIKGTESSTNKEHLRTKANMYLDRAEEIKVHLEQQKETGQYHEQQRIENNSLGHSYKSVFGHLLDDMVTSIDVEDPYIRNVHQVYNFIRFCELVIQSCKNIRKMLLITSPDEGAAAHTQLQRLEEVKRSLNTHNVTLTLQFSPTLHDREIRLDNGWVIKIGRGLDYFRLGDGKFSIGFCDMDLRPCYETTVDIFHRKHIKNTSNSDET